MKVAIVHDSLVEFGGAERVLLALLELYPDAHVYTGYADKIFVKTFFPDLDWSCVHPSWASGTIIAKHGSLFQCFSPFVWRSFNLEQYDLVLSVTSYLAANMVRVKHSIHIQYILSLPKNLFGLEPAFWLQQIFPYGPIVSRIFCQSLFSTPYILSDSEHIRCVLYEKTGIESKVIYPPVNIPRLPPKRKKPEYYLCVTRIDNTKSIEIAIEACTRLKLRLKIAGKTNDPKYEQHLRSIAGPTVEFLGFLSDKEIHELYVSAKAFIFTAKNEDFGIAPIEAMAHGVPVIAYYGGGAKETVVPGKTGEFFYEHSAKDLMRVITAFNSSKYSSKAMRVFCLRYSKNRFRKEIKTYVDAVISGSDFPLFSDRDLHKSL